VDASGTPVGWKVGASEANTPHVLLLVGADDAIAFHEAVDVLKSRTGPGSGFDVMYEDEGSRLPDDREHFGFRDGISQPGLRGRLNSHPESFVTRRYLDPADPLSERFARPGQPLIWPGQFIFGYPAQDEFSEGPGEVATPPEGWMKNGSFLVFRRLRQDVRGFREFCAEQSATVSQQLGRAVSADEIGGWLVGRWPDGSSLVRCPEAPCAPSDGEQALNHFDYSDAVPATRVHTPHGQEEAPGAPGDAQGLRCPFFAHVRKLNLRDKPTDIRPSVFFRILRRGIPYGPPFRDDETEPVDRGLLFVSYQQSLNQFMTLSSLWMNQATSPEGPNGHDLLVGQSHKGRSATRKFADGTTARMESAPGRQWVIPTGGGFFFTPSKSVIANLGGASVLT
jgi:Dyp-type peroxidase family